MTHTARALKVRTARTGSRPRGYLILSYLSATLSERPAARLRFTSLRPFLVFIRARKPMPRLRLIRLVRCG